jgi:hypothetical protein
VIRAATMNLPVRILDKAPREPVLSVDGACYAPGLNLSHWAGHATPAELRHDLSTGSALLFAALAAERRAELARGCTAIVNNHFDTDGLCSLFSVRYPEQAIARRASLLEAAACGDFFQFPSEKAFVIDAIVGGFVDEERSPWRADFAGLDRRARYELAAHRALPVFAEILDGAVESYVSLWEAPLAILRADLAELSRAARDELTHLDFTVWTGPGAESFDPGRHALFGSSPSDRQLVIGPGPRGATYRFLIGTFSWFDLVTRDAQPRPDLVELCARLNELEGTRAEADVAWRQQDVQGASPELWFGSADFETFEEHAAPVLKPSALDPLRVKAEVLEALRACWAFPS